MVSVTIKSGSDSRTVQFPVLDASLKEYAKYLPTVSASPSPSVSGSVTPGSSTTLGHQRDPDAERERNRPLGGRRLRRVSNRAGSTKTKRKGSHDGSPSFCYVALCSPYAAVLDRAGPTGSYGSNL